MTTNPQFSQGTAPAHALCSLAMAFKVLATANFVLLCALLLVATGWRVAAERFFIVALWLEPATLISMAALCFLSRRGFANVHTFMATTAAVCAALAAASQLLFVTFSSGAPIQAACIGGLAGAFGFSMLHRQAQSAAPALQEADLRSLGAAMRPHFFFNALNAVMGLIRANPKQAEDMLQDTAELFRDVMAQDQRRLVTLEAELDTTRRYARIEQARLAERLQIDWRIDAALLGAVLPPFTLQLLLENAIRHGIERLPEGGVVQVSASRKGQFLQIAVLNPVLQETTSKTSAKPSGDLKHNGVAIDNLTQRLALLYDQSASLARTSSKHQHLAKVALPLEFEA